MICWRLDLTTPRAARRSTPSSESRRTIMTDGNEKTRRGAIPDVHAFFESEDSLNKPAENRTLKKVFAVGEIRRQKSIKNTESNPKSATYR